MTAVEWLVNELKKPRADVYVTEIINKALEIEREQIISAAMWIPEEFGSEFIPQLGERYYNETYKSENAPNPYQYY